MVLPSEAHLHGHAYGERFGFTIRELKYEPASPFKVDDSVDERGIDRESGLIKGIAEKGPFFIEIVKEPPDQKRYSGQKADKVMLAEIKSRTDCQERKNSKRTHKKLMPEIAAEQRDKKTESGNTP